MSNKILNRLVAFGVFLVTAIVYIKTLSVTVVFWDVGEFCSASYLLQVPHPPGSPLFLLVARVGSMLPFFSDLAARMHVTSAMGSALGIMFLYLVAVKTIIKFRGIPETTIDRLVVYGASAIGAWTLAFTSTYWENSTEAEVYGMSMLFVSIIMWLAYVWWDKADEPHNEKYIILIAYLIGLSLGVHLLSLLCIFTVMLVIYLRRYEITRQSIIKFCLVAVIGFFIIYPGIVQFLPSMLDGEFKGQQSDIFPFIPILVLIGVAYGAYRTIKTQQKMLHIACLMFLFITLGFTTYVEVIIRANVPNIPMNENDPSVLAHFTSYITREQYGDTPLLKGESWDNDLQSYRTKLFPRRFSQEPMHEPTRANYTSDWDFMWNWQINHMFVRYILWNFVGVEGDWQDAGVSWKYTWGIPLLFSLLGFYYHVRRDLKNSIPWVVLFLVMGLAFALYANMQQPQPRERDYFYVGAFYVMALWVAVGVVALIDLLKSVLSYKGAYNAGVSGVLAICAIAVPVNLVRVGWFEHDRSGDYMAWDYSYNMLQSCEQDGILITNGDNDTFPLWYLQDVEGVRRDVRIVNLSLVNTPWYILQLKNQTPHGAKKVPISFTDQQIERLQPVMWRSRQLDIPVPKDVAERFGVTDTAILNSGKITFTMAGIPIRQDMRILRVQDIMLRDIIMTNKWERPIFLATTCSPDSKIGLDNYLWMRGFTWKLKPVRTSAEGGVDIDIMEANVLAKDVKASKTPQSGYIYRNLNNPNVYYDENCQRMAMNYRFGFMRLASYALAVQNNREKAKNIMEQLEQTVSIKALPIQDWTVLSYMMNLFKQVGNNDGFDRYSKEVESKCLEIINTNQADMRDNFNPYSVLLDIYETRKDYPSALGILNRLLVNFPNDPNLNNRIRYYENLMKGSSIADTNKPK
jgi:hypothetical protein